MASAVGLGGAEAGAGGVASASHGARLAYLDGWRAIAVAVVIQSHLLGFRIEPLWLKAIARWAPAGQIGVLVFFFISGYVITRSALGEIGKTGDFSVPGFYIRRVFRIIPPLALYLIVCLILGAFGIVAFTPGNALPAFLYVCNIGPPVGDCAWLGGHTWSLAFEEQFYLLFAPLLVLILLRRMPFPPHLLFAIAFCLAPLIFPLSYIGWRSYLLTYGLFAGGVLAARYEAVLARWLTGRADLVFWLTALLVFVATPLTLWWQGIADNYPLTFIITIPLMVLASGSSRVRPFFEMGWLRYLGRISYGIYLWQELATSALFDRGPLAFELLALAGVVVLCAILFEAMEKPLISAGRRLAERVTDDRAAARAAAG